MFDSIMKVVKFVIILFIIWFLLSSFPFFNIPFPAFLQTVILWIVRILGTFWQALKGALNM